MIAVRSGQGLGDSLYLQSIARHLVAKGEKIEVCTKYPDVFLPLNDKVRVSPFRRDRVDRVAHYITRKRVPNTDQFRDCCISAGLNEKVELRLDWSVQNQSLVRPFAESSRPVIVVQLPRSPMDRMDGYGEDLLPDCRTIQRAIDLLAERAIIVQVGKGKPLFEFERLTVDLANKTSVADVIDIVSVADAVLGFCSFIVPLAESLSKPALLVWSQRGLQSSTDFIRAITPQKIFHRDTSRAVMDDCSQDELAGAVNALCDAIRVPEPV